MEQYNYRKVMVNNIKDWIQMNGVIQYAKEQEWSQDKLAEWLNDEVWDQDTITGNGPYYFAPEEMCQQFVATNLPLYFEAASEFCDFPTGKTPWIYKNPAQHMDTTIRCYLLYECIYKALEELNYENLSGGAV